MKTMAFEGIKKELENNNIKVDYVAPIIMKDVKNGVVLDGYTEDSQVWVYINNNLYLKMAKYIDAIRYEIYFGKKISEPLLRADIDFEEMNSEHYTVPYMTIFCGEEQRKIALLLKGGVEEEIRGIFEDVLGDNIKELVAEYEDMLRRLLPSINASIMIFNNFKGSKEYTKVN